MKKRIVNSNKGALAPFRVLDLTDEKGMLCGKILASMGAEVIKVEAPGGDKARNLPPFFHDKPDPEMSLYYFANNTNKKSITLNIETVDGQLMFKKLVKVSDFVLESFKPGYMDGLGLGYAELSKINPRIIVTSISPLGMTGPYSSYKSSEIMCLAMSGFMYLTGDSDRAPLMISFPQAYSMGAADAVAATMIAHYYRQKTGEGQLVDVSIRDAMIKATINVVQWTDHYGTVLKRGGPTWGLRGSPIRVLWPCRDGWLSWALHGTKFGAKTNRQLVEWMDNEKMADDVLKSIDFESLDMETVNPELVKHLEEDIALFFMNHTREDIMDGAVKRGIMMSPVQTMEDIANNEQLKSRKYWEDVAHPDLNTTISYPGAFIKVSETPCITAMKAPHIGEHNEEIYIDILGISREQLIILKAAKAI